MKIADIESKVNGVIYELHLHCYLEKGSFADVDLVNANLSGLIYPSEAGLVQDMQDLIAIFDEHQLYHTPIWGNIQVADKEFGWVFYDWSPCGEVCAVMYWSPQRGYQEKKYNGEDFDGSVCAIVGKFCEEYLSK